MKRKRRPSGGRGRGAPAGGAAVHIETAAIHAGQHPEPVTGAVMTPVFLTSTYAQAAPGKTLAAVEERIDAVLRGLAEAPVPADELAKAKTRLRADLVRSLKTVSGKANRIGFAEVVFGDHRALASVETQWLAVTAEDVRRVVGTYLGPDRKTVVTLDPLRPGGAKP